MKTINFFLAMFLTGCFINTDPGNGRKIGKIVRLSKQGILNKTWEGELIRGGLTDGSGVFGGSFDFTIEDSTMARRAYEALENEKEVLLDYQVVLLYGCSRSESSHAHFVTKITFLEDK